MDGLIKDFSAYVQTLKTCSSISDRWLFNVTSVYANLSGYVVVYTNELSDDQKNEIKKVTDLLHSAKSNFKDGEMETALNSVQSAITVALSVELNLSGVSFSEAPTLELPTDEAQKIRDQINTQIGVPYGLHH